MLYLHMLRALAILFLFLSSVADAMVFPIKVQKEAVVEVNVIDKSGRTIMAGKGYIVDSEGLIATDCRMVLRWYEDIQNDLIVKTTEGNFPLYRLIAYNRDHGLAIFKINTEGLPSISLDSRDKTTAYIKRVVKIYKDMSRASKQTSKERHATKETEGFQDVEPEDRRSSREARNKGSVDFPSTSPFLSGLRYVSLKRYREAIEEFEKAIRIEPINPEIYMNLGLAYYKIGMYRDSIDAFKRALLYGAVSKSVYNKLGSLYIVLGEYNEAVDAFRKALSIDNTDPMSHFNLAIALFMKGDSDEAWNEYILLRGLDEGLARRLWDIIN